MKDPIKNPQKYQWFMEARFGMFIHWGLYSLLGRGEQVLFREHLDPDEYSKNANVFKGENFDAEAWARSAYNAGMKYMVLTSKHHDGYCLFKTATTKYNSVETAAGRDFIEEYTRACRKFGLKVGIYFSLPDWRFPAYFAGPDKDPQAFEHFIRYTHEQVRELCANYGKIDLIWFDGLDWPHTGESWQSTKLVESMRALQPDILINNRVPKPKEGGDWGYYTPEGHIGAAEGDEMTESCMSSGRFWWGYLKGEKYWKTGGDVIASIVSSAEGGSNFLYNVGPEPEGTFPEPYAKGIREAGIWLEKNGRSIYGSSKGISDVTTVGCMTVKDNSVFIHILYWPGIEVCVAGLKSKAVSATYLATGESIRFRQDDGHIYLEGLPEEAPDPHCTVVEILMDGEPKAHPWGKNILWRGDSTLMTDWAGKGLFD